MSRSSGAIEMPPVAISVIVPTHNRLEILQETIRRLLEQDSAPQGHELVVVDDRSEDGSYEWLVHECEAKPCLRPIRNRSAGRAAARNTGVESARGEVICFLDDDMWVGPGFLRAHWRAHRETRPRPIAAVGKMRPWPGNEPTVANRAYDRRLARIDTEMAGFPGALPCNYLCTGNVSLPRALFDAGPAFDEGFPGYSFEDTDLGYRLAERGVELRYVAEACAEHRTSTTVGDLLRKQSEAGRSAVYLLRKHPQAASRLGVPFEIPGVPTTCRHDSLPKAIAKAIAFHGLTGGLLEALLWGAAAVRAGRLADRLLQYASYHRYGRAYRQAARELAAAQFGPKGGRAKSHDETG